MIRFFQSAEGFEIDGVVLGNAGATGKNAPAVTENATAIDAVVTALTNN
jgi:hypothetical protein